MAQHLVISPNMSVIRTRNTILRMKNRSPKFKDVLRQKFKERMKQDRLKLIDKFRRVQLNNDFQNDFLSVITEEVEDDNLSMEVEEIKPIQSAIAPKKTKENLLPVGEDAMTEHEKWLLQEYISFLSDEDPNGYKTVICPLCKMGAFENHFNHSSPGISCRNCKKSFLTHKTLPEIHKDIFDALSEHNKQCDCDPDFGVEKLDNNKEILCVFCNKCFYLKYLF